MAKKYLVQCDLREGIRTVLFQDEVAIALKHDAMELVDYLRRSFAEEGFMTMYEDSNYIKMTRNNKEEGIFITARIRLEEIEK